MPACVTVACWWWWGMSRKCNIFKHNKLESHIQSEQSNLSFNLGTTSKGLNFPSFYPKGGKMVAIYKYILPSLGHLFNITKKVSLQINVSGSSDIAQ